MNTIRIFLFWMLVTKTHAEFKALTDIYYLDKEKGILTSSEETVYTYDGFIFVPIVYSLPTCIPIIEKKVDIPLQCNYYKPAEEALEIILNNIRKKLPEITPIKNRPRLQDTILKDKKLIVKNQKEESNIPSIYNRNTTKTTHDLNYLIHDFSHHDLTNRNITEKIRIKRLAPLLLFTGVATLGTLAGLSIYNRVDISDLKDRINGLEDYQTKIYQHVEKNIMTTNLLIDENQKIFSVVSNITEKLNELIQEHNCDRMSNEIFNQFLTEWALDTPNSFMRAVNGALLGTLTLDLLPGNHLNDLIRYYPEFVGTIFEEYPNMLYQSAKIHVVRLEKNPLMIEVVMTVPKLNRIPFGKRYIQSSCHWSFNNKFMKIKHQESAILAVRSNTWWSDKNCKSLNNIMLCDVRDMDVSQNNCFNHKNQINLTSCSLEIVSKKPDNEVITTKGGMLVCKNNNQFTTFKSDQFGMIQTKVIKMNESIFLTEQDADTILVGNVHYSLLSSVNVVKIYPAIILDDVNNNESLISRINTIPEHHYIQQLDDIVPYQHYHTAGITSLFVIIIAIIIMLCIGYYLYKKKNRKTKKQLGYIMNMKEGKLTPIIQRLENEEEV